MKMIESKGMSDESWRVLKRVEGVTFPVNKNWSKLGYTFYFNFEKQKFIKREFYRFSYFVL